MRARAPPLSPAESVLARPRLIFRLGSFSRNIGAISGPPTRPPASVEEEAEEGGEGSPPARAEQVRLIRRRRLVFSTSRESKGAMQRTLSCREKISFSRRGPSSSPPYRFSLGRSLNFFGAVSFPPSVLMGQFLLSYFSQDCFARVGRPLYFATRRPRHSDMHLLLLLLLPAAAVIYFWLA